VSILDGGELPIIWGLQGGTWTMPSVKAEQPQMPVVVVAEVTSGGEIVGSSPESQLYWSDPIGSDQTSSPLRIQILPPTGDVEDLYGQEATFVATLTEPGGEEVIRLRVTLVERF
jgi:hypothetical protein